MSSPAPVDPRPAEEYRDRHERTRAFSVCNEAPHGLRHLDGA